MNLATISAIAIELSEDLIGRRFGRVFQLSRVSFAIDFRLTDGRYLFVSVEPAAPRIYLIQRKLKDIEKASSQFSPFALLLKKYLSGATVTAIRQIEGERCLLLRLTGITESGVETNYSLAVQLTGRSANFFLLDGDDRIVDRLRDTKGEGQEVGDVFRPPERSLPMPADTGFAVAGTTGSWSETLDRYYLERDENNRFNSLANAARAKLKQETAKRRRLLERMKADLEQHGDAEHWKRLGDLLLANLSTAKREGGRVSVTDYFSDDASELVIEIAEEDTLSGAAEKFFRRYTKARNAANEIQGRIANTLEELQVLEGRENELEHAIESRDEEFVRSVAGVKLEPTGRKRETPVGPTGAKKFISSDGLEILVGKKSTDNDHLTFRVAKSLDLWMHAADYPGSHVVVRNPNRREIPQRTLLEAAQLAAFYSQGKSQPKAAVHYTQKKYVNKPRGAAPGLVSLAQFKTILVEPAVPDTIQRF